MRYRRGVDAVLMVDDDVELCALVAEYLHGHGYDVTAIHDGAAGLRAALSDEHELVVLDVMLPVLDGFEVLRQLRQRSNVPVIMLTARAEETDRVNGFSEGADDYLVKPFAAAELLGRVRAVLRRSSQSPAAPATVTQAGDITLDARSRAAFRDGVSLDLTPTEPGGWERNPAVRTDDSSVLGRPLKEILLRVSKRVEWQGEWKLEMGESKTRIPLAV